MKTLTPGGPTPQAAGLGRQRRRNHSAWTHSLSGIYRPLLGTQGEKVWKFENLSWVGVFSSARCLSRLFQILAFFTVMNKFLAKFWGTWRINLGPEPQRPDQIKDPAHRNTDRSRGRPVPKCSVADPDGSVTFAWIRNCSGSGSSKKIKIADK